MTEERQRAEFATNLTREVSPLVGRGALSAVLTAAFDRGERLITLVGPGGAGKTALASSWARTAGGLGLREAWFCDLSAATTAPEIGHIVKVALGLPNGANYSIEELSRRLGTAIAERGRILIVLDNFEHLVEHAAVTLGRWLQLAWDATFLVTSRQRLHLPEEHVVEVGPLAEEDAIELFCARARAVEGGFALAPGDREGVRQIVRRLDALPLAIQMVAPWVQTLSIDDLATRIAFEPGLLVLDDPCAPARHVDLEATFRWSWVQLSALERETLHLLSRLFHGRFTLDTAEAVWPRGDGPPLVAVVRNLVERSVLRTIRGEPHPDSVSFACYQSFVPLLERAVGDEGAPPERLRASAARFVALAEDHAGKLRSGAFAEALAWLERHRADLAALSLGFEGEAPALAAAAELVLLRLAARAGPLDELAPRAERGLELAERAGERTQMAEARRHRAESLWIERRLEEARREVAAASALLPAGADRLAGELASLRARVARDLGEYEAAAAACEEARAAFARAGDGHGEALALITSATGKAMDEATDAALAALTEAARVADGLGDALLDGHLESALATWHGNRGDSARSIAHHRRALERFTAAGDVGQRIRVLGFLGVALFDSGAAPDGLACIDEALEEARLFGLGAALGEEGVDASALNQRRLEAVARLMTFGGDHVVAGVTGGHLAAMLIRRGELDAARDAYERGLRHVLNHPEEGRPAIHFQGLLASLDLAAGRFESALAGYRRALGWLPRWEGPAREAIGKLLELTIDLGERRKVPNEAREDHAVRQLLALIELAPRLSPVVAMGVSSLRLALFSSPRVVERTRLRVGPDGRWFELDGAGRVDLGRSGAICRILRALGAAARGGLGPLPMMRLFEVGWPGEKVSAGSAANRVYAALARLRSLGLREVLVRQRDGWCVDPTLVVELDP